MFVIVFVVVVAIICSLLSDKQNKEDWPFKATGKIFHADIGDSVDKRL